jgi:hypothetical protein
MPSRQTFIRHRFNGGFATDFGSISDSGFDQAGNLPMGWLNRAENCIYELDGSPRKVPGITKLNATAMESGATVNGVFDFWLTGGAGSAAQHRIVHVGTKIKKDDADASFTDLFTGLEANKIPTYTVLDDLLIMASTSTADVPKSWDGSTAQNLAGSPPNFSICTTHRNRVWAAGNVAAPSRLYYSGYLEPTNWTAGGSGFFDINPNDGDKITGMTSFKGELIVFKGPYMGSIHRIAGSSPTGFDPFRRSEVTGRDGGVGAVHQNTIFRISDDIGFLWSDGTLRTLSATQQFGDLAEAALSRPINGWIREHVNFGSLEAARAVNWTEYGQVLISMPIDASTTPNIILMGDYRFQPARWALWPAFKTQAIALASVVDSASSNRRIIMGGGSDGFVRKFGQTSRSIDGGTSIPFRIDTPFMNYGTPHIMKTLAAASLALDQNTGFDATLGWTKDGKAEQTVTIRGNDCDVLGPATAPNKPFILDQSLLCGDLTPETFSSLDEQGGEFRAISYSVRDNALNSDVIVHSVSAFVEGGSVSLEN